MPQCENDAINLTRKTHCSFQERAFDQNHFCGFSVKMVYMQVSFCGNVFAVNSER